MPDCDGLSEVRDQQHPSVQKLRAAITEWKKGMTFGQKLKWRLTGSAYKPIELGFPPGELE
jgi:hypothetical protein